ncbi:MAG TPA: CPBP family intramembrane metalloprotease [Firmicutes bacterium]|nr:CPBP family intramembrane metalloprotease [Bacillota bacterium]
MAFYVFILASMILKAGFQEWYRHHRISPCIALSGQGARRAGSDEKGDKVDGEEDGASCIDLGDVIIIVLLAATGLIARVDPAEFYGFQFANLRTCPWATMALIWAGAFALNRVVRASVPRELLPDGTFQLLGGYSLPAVASAGIAFVAMQTLWEELLFRGAIFNACTLLLETGGTILDRGAAPVDAKLAAAVLSSAVFGLAHFLPLQVVSCSHINGIPGRGNRSLSSGLGLAKVYALVMPCVCGLIFIKLNSEAGSLIPGWVMHFGLNYGSLIWNKVWLGKRERLWMKATLNSRT